MLIRQKGEENAILWFQKYRVIRKLGHGGSAEVYLVLHERLDCCRAVKRIEKQTCDGEQLIKEISVLKNLRHSNIPIIYDIEEDDNYYYIIEEYVEGQSLRAYRLAQGNISENGILELMLQICQVLIFLHSREQSILYLDLNPDNILLSGNTIKLIDFGASVFKKDAARRESSYGTKGYAAPEQYGICHIDERTDVYGAGGLMYFLLSGESYREEDGIERLNSFKQYSRPLKQVIRKCLSYNPGRRYQTIKELDQKLRQIEKGSYLKKNSQKTAPQVFSFAGAVKRIGTTHVCLMITRHLNKNGIRALYVECNDSGQMFQMLKNGMDSKDCPMVHGEIRQICQSYERYQVYVCDYGMLSPDKSGFYEADRCFLVVGTKPWEWMRPEKNGKIEYLINFAGASGFARVSKRLNKSVCLRVPYEPEPFLEKGGAGRKFLDQITGISAAKNRRLEWKKRG